MDSIYHKTLKLLKNRVLASLTQRYNGRHYVTLLNLYTLVVNQFYYMALYHSQTSCNKYIQ